MATILGDENSNSPIPLVSVICLVPIGTYIHIRYCGNEENIHIHKVKSALKALEFMAEINKLYNHHLYVCEIKPKETQIGLVLELVCK